MSTPDNVLHRRLSGLRVATIPRLWSLGTAGPEDIAAKDPLLQLSHVPATGFLDRLRNGAGRRPLALGLALAIEGILLLLLLSFGWDKPPGKEEESLTVVNVRANEAPEKAPEPVKPEPEQRVAERPVPQPPVKEEALPPQPVKPKPAPPLRPLIPSPQALPAPASPAPQPRRVYGPPNIGAPISAPDSERVGTAPNGEPLYAAAWYREPTEGELRGYLSTALGPGWGLIACRTVAEYRVEDCVALDEYPAGSLINRAVLAAAWQFKVRPPRLGGRPLVGSWVRIRIDYDIRRQ